MIHNTFGAIFRGALIALLLGALTGAVIAHYMGYDLRVDEAVEAVRQVIWVGEQEG